MRISTTQYILAPHTKMQQLSPICQHRPHHDIPCYNMIAWFGMVSGITVEYLILLHGNFCYKKGTAP